MDSRPVQPGRRMFQLALRQAIREDLPSKKKCDRMKKDKWKTRVENCTEEVPKANTIIPEVAENSKESEEKKPRADENKITFPNPIVPKGRGRGRGRGISDQSSLKHKVGVEQNNESLCGPSQEQQNIKLHEFNKPKNEMDINLSPPTENDVPYKPVSSKNEFVGLKNRLNQLNASSLIYGIAKDKCVNLKLSISQHSIYDALGNKKQNGRGRGQNNGQLFEKLNQPLSTMKTSFQSKDDKYSPEDNTSEMGENSLPYFPICAETIIGLKENSNTKLHNIKKTDSENNLRSLSLDCPHDYFSQYDLKNIKEKVAGEFKLDENNNPDNENKPPREFRDDSTDIYSSSFFADDIDSSHYSKASQKSNAPMRIKSYTELDPEEINYFDNLIYSNLGSSCDLKTQSSIAASSYEHIQRDNEVKHSNKSLSEDEYIDDLINYFCKNQE